MNNTVFCVSYDLLTPGKNYDGLINAIKSYGTWWHQTESVWFIVSDKGAGEIRDFLMSYLDNNDKLFVIAVLNHWGGKGFSNNEYDWLKTNLK